MILFWSCKLLIRVICRDVEVADGIGDLGSGMGEPFEMFEKEDMSDMFERAMLEKMQLFGWYVYVNFKSSNCSLFRRTCN